jgi:site-specific recombinase XerC
MPVLLSDAIDEFLTARASQGYRANTVRNDGNNLRQLLAHIGNIQVKNVTFRHIDEFMAAGQAKGLEASTLNLRLCTLRAFFRHCTHRKYIAAANDPTTHRRKYRDPGKSRLRVPVFDFNRLLDSADNPRDRIVVALGLYLLLRSSEIRLLTISDVDLNGGTMRVVVPKTSKYDDMPICAELDAELRTWLTYYGLHAGRPLRPTDALVPVWKTGKIVRLPDGRVRISKAEGLMADRPYTSPHLAVQAALVSCGYVTRDASGKSLREGVHTLRRSAARARFDALGDQGVDRALRHVQSMLHHASVSTTEHYIGLDGDKVARDELVRGKVMFPAAKAAATLRKVGS